MNSIKNSRDIVLHQRQLCYSKMALAKMLEEMKQVFRKHDFSKAYPILKPMEPLSIKSAKLRTTYLLVMHRCSQAVREQRKHICRRKQIQLNISSYEKLRFFLIDELCRLRYAFRVNPKLYRNHLILNMKKQGFVLSKCIEDDGTFVNEEYLYILISESIAQIVKPLQMQHRKMQKLFALDNLIATRVVQTLWQCKRTRMFIQNIELKWKNSLIRSHESKKRFFERKQMAAYDSESKMYWRFFDSTMLIQRVTRGFLTRIKLNGSAALTEHERRRLKAEKEQDETFKKKMREDIISERRLKAWKCKTCKKFGAKHRVFSSWKAVEEHVDEHKRFEMLKKKVRKEKEAKVNVVKVVNLEHENAFLQKLYRLRQRNQAIGLVRAEFLKTFLRKEKKRTTCIYHFILSDLIEYKYFHLRDTIPRVLILQKKTTVGRGKRNSWVLDSPKCKKMVSKNHLLIQIMDKEECVVQVVDKNSTNGTTIEDVRLTANEKTLMYRGNVLYIGSKEKTDLAFVLCSLRC